MELQAQYQLMPELTADEFDSLKADIAARVAAGDWGRMARRQSAETR